MSTAATLKAAATGQEQAQTGPRNHYDAFKRQLEASKGEFLPLLGGSKANVDEFIRVVLNAAMQNPELLHADRRSLLISCMRAAQDGLMPDGHESVLNVYSNKVTDNQGRESWIQAVQYLPMVHGVVKNLYATGEILTLDAAVVYEKEVKEGRFRFVRGDSPRLEHEPTMDDQPGDIVAAYCVVKLRNGELKREVMPWRDIERVRAMSKSGTGKNSPWVKWLDQQCIKSVIHRIKKQLPKMPAVDRMLDADNEATGPADIPTPAQAARPAAITHQPAEAFDFGSFTAPQREPVHAERTDTQQAGQQQAAAPQRDEAPIFDADAFAARMQACTSADALDAMADDIRGIASEQTRIALGEVYERRASELREAAAAKPGKAPAPGAPVANPF